MDQPDEQIQASLEMPFSQAARGTEAPAVAPGSPQYAAQPDIYAQFQRALPELHRNWVPRIAAVSHGSRALATLFSVAPALKGAPLWLPAQQIATVAERGKSPALLELKAFGRQLTEPPIDLKPIHLVSIACNENGRTALEAVRLHMETLRSLAYGLNVDQVAAIASKHGGKRTLETVVRLMPTLLGLGSTVARVVSLASKSRGHRLLKLELEELSRDRPAVPS